MDGSCNVVDIIASCPCHNVAECGGLLRATMSQIPHDVQPKAQALMDACTQILGGGTSEPDSSEAKGMSGISINKSDEDGAPEIGRELLGADGPVVNVDDPATRALVDMIELGGIIGADMSAAHARPLSPFHDLPHDEYPYLMRLLWWSARYTYQEDGHYSALIPGTNSRNSELETNLDVQYFTAKKGEKGAKIDALISIVRPRPGWTYTDITPSEWYCLKYFERSFCQDPSTQFLHISVRGMRMYNQLTTPDSDDLLHMRGMPQIIKCRFQYEEQVLSMRISEGSCVILQALVKSGMVGHVVDKLQVGHKYMLVLHGLSYGAAVAQPAALLLHWALSAHRHSLPVDLDADVRMGVMLFGSPRVGDQTFAHQIDDMHIPVDQFVMYTYVKGSKLFYDSVAMHPEHLVPVGNVVSMVFYAKSTDSLSESAVPLTEQSSTVVTQLTHDLFVRPSSPFNLVTSAFESRLVPDSDANTFFCLHFFHKYQAFFEERFCSTWCNPVSLPRVA